MYPPTPPNVNKYGAYRIDDTCNLLWIGRDTLRERSDDGLIKRSYLEDDTIIYYAKDILRFWFIATKQPITDGQLDHLLNSMAEKGYEATFGCPPPVRPEKKPRKQRSSNKDVRQ